MSLKPLLWTKEQWEHHFFGPVQTEIANLAGRAKSSYYPVLVTHIYLKTYLQQRYRQQDHRAIWGSRLPHGLIPDLTDEQKNLLVELGMFDYQTRLAKGVSIYAQKALVLWALGTFPLHLCYYKPDPWEVLDLQRQGKRMVTLYLSWEKFVGDGNTPKWDPGTFLLHDLKHAYLFFADTSLRRGQKAVYELFWGLKYHPRLQKSLDQNPTWAKPFYYLISDMNTHPIHLIRTAHAIFRIHGYHALWEEYLRELAPVYTSWPAELAQSCLEIEEYFTSPPRLQEFWQQMTQIN